MPGLTEYLQTHSKKHIVFDLDGTLVKVRFDWSEVGGLKQIIARFDRHIAETVPFQPHNGTAMFNIAVAKYGMPFKQAVDRYFEEYETNHHHGHAPNKELMAFIRHESSRYRFYLWSNNTRKITDLILEKEGIKDLFAGIVTRTETIRLKPEPDGFSRIYDPSIPKQEYLMVGDEVADMEAAKRAGIDFILADYFPRTAAA